MYTQIGFKTDYSLLSSLLKTKDIIKYAENIKAKYIGILDDNPYAIMDFYTKAKKTDIKPIIGMVVKIGDNKIYLYIKNYEGYKNIININSLILSNKLTIDELINLREGLKCVLPYESYKLYNRLKTSFDVYLGYKSKEELKNASLITKNVLFINEIRCFKKSDLNVLKVLYKIDDKTYEDESNYILETDQYDNKTIEEFVSDINFEMPKYQRYIPSYTGSEKESENLLQSLAIKGLYKRLDGKIADTYKKRLTYELDVIKKLGFIDYFLIVYDYVKYAKKSNIYVGPGRGSAAGSLVSYSLGITEIDPIKYDLLFERFLNPERVTMPDIDIDFEDIKRNDVINYVREKYGEKKVSLIVAYGTLGSKQVLRDVGKIFNIDENIISTLTKKIDAKKSLKDNYNEEVKKYVEENKLETVYKVSMKLEGIKKHTTMHAAGVIISSINLTEIIPVFKTNDGLLAGYTAEYLESLGLLKMDFLALRNLTIMHNIVDLISEKNKDFSINKIPLDDENTYKLFRSGNTDDIFQFESMGMKNFLKKLEPSKFDDLVAANALFRPGPMKYIDEYIDRKKGKKQITYINKDLKDILEDTYGIIVYQEQIMKILSLMGGYSFAEADNIRRAMSKKKKEVLTKERDTFINRAISKGYKKEEAINVYDMILRFANYGFNKSHSVAYASLGYKIAYLKANYKEYFDMSLLNLNASSETKIKDIIKVSREKGLKIIKPNINLSEIKYVRDKDTIILPLSIIKNIGTNVCETIYNNKPYEDFFDFFKKNYNKGVNRINIELLINAGAMDDFGYSRNTLLENIDSAITYLELCENLDESLIMKPEIVKSTRLDEEINEKELFGFYISEHPAIKAREEGMIRIYDTGKYVGKTVKFVGLVDKLKVINTKTGEKMAFISISDESSSIECVIFPKKNYLLELFKEEDLVSVIASINIRNDEKQAIINDISVVEYKGEKENE